MDELLSVDNDRLYLKIISAMNPEDKDLGIELSELEKLTSTIKETYKYDFTNYAMSSFRRRTWRILEKYELDSVEVLTKKIQDDVNFFKEVLSEITVSVTEMFRDPSMWQILRDDVIPDILKKPKIINIWHAGCCTGEEVVSIAILLKEMELLEFARITATDIDHVILETASKCMHPMRHMDTNTKNYTEFSGKAKLSDYYKEENDMAKMDRSLIEKVTFKEHDLVAGKPFSKFDLIICRNVMIYFNQKLQNDVLKLLHQSLEMNGYLIIGQQESLIWCEIANKFSVVNYREKIYKKIEG